MVNIYSEGGGGGEFNTSDGEHTLWENVLTHLIVNIYSGEMFGEHIQL